MTATTAAGVVPAEAPFRQFLCLVCGLVYDEALGDPDSGLAPGTRFDDIAPDWACPVCGVGKADFVPYDAAAAAAALAAARAAPGAASMQAAAGHPAPSGVQPRQRRPGIVVVGAGRAGWQVVQALRSAGSRDAITLVSACNGDVYDKPQLSVAVARRLAPNALVREPAAAAAARLGVRLLAHTHAVAIDPDARRLRTTRGTLCWQQLVLAQGAAPVLPAPLQPAQAWQINDLTAYRGLRARLDGGPPQQLAIVGAGLLGCELANDLALAGHQISLLDLQTWPLAAQLPASAGQQLLAAWQGLPLQFIGGVRVTGLAAASGPGPRWRLALAPAVQAADGAARGAAALPAQLRVDLVLAATGLRTPGRLAASAGLAFDNALGGIVVDGRSGATSRHGIWALGDCVVADGQANRCIAPIAHQAAQIAAQITGQPAPADTGAPAALLRIKTTAMPITLQRHAAGVGTWQAVPDSAAALRLHQHDAQGRLLATLVAARGAPRPAADQPGTPGGGCAGGHCGGWPGAAPLLL